MRRSKTIVILSVLMCFLFGCTQSPYVESADSNYSVGYSEGHFDGNVSGFDEGYKEGFTNGERTGYYAGAVYACFYFGDIEKAFKCADKYFAWNAFVGAYDEYVSDIYSTEEERFSILFALFSWDAARTNPETEFTDEERNILLSTFGYELFLANGFDIRNN